MCQPEKPVSAMPSLREELQPSDLPQVINIVQSAGNFTDEEVDVALEVAEDYLQRGTLSGYKFLLDTRNGTTCGFCCYGPIPCTYNRFEIYWIVVDGNYQQAGIGTGLLRTSEERIKAMGGTAVYLDTSSKNNYLAARRFYEKNGYRTVAVLADFYTEGDDKIIYRKLM